MSVGRVIKARCRVYGSTAADRLMHQLQHLKKHLAFVISQEAEVAAGDRANGGSSNVLFWKLVSIVRRGGCDNSRSQGRINLALNKGDGAMTSFGNPWRSPFKAARFGWLSLVSDGIHKRAVHLHHVVRAESATNTAPGRHIALSFGSRRCGHQK